jgi:hypothetical protein
MANDKNVSLDESLIKKVVNKGRARQKRYGHTIYPSVGYLDACDSQRLVFLRNGGQITRTESFLVPNTLVTAKLSNTCSIDNVLMCVAAMLKWNKPFARSMDELRDAFPNLLEYLYGISHAQTFNDAALHRYQLLNSLRHSTLRLVTENVVYGNFYSSERDMANTLLGEMIGSHRYFRCYVCTIEKRFSNGVMDIPVEAGTRCVNNINLFIQTEYLHAKRHICERYVPNFSTRESAVM